MKKLLLVSVLVGIPMLASGFTTAREKKFTINILGGGGVTFVNIPTDLDINPNWLSDWDKINWRVTAQGIYKITPTLGVGGEFGFNTLYYAYWHSPSVTWGHYVTATAFDLAGLLELRLYSSLYLQAGMGLFMFKESAAIDFFTALGGDIFLSESLSIPVMVRFDAIPGAPMPLTLLLGLKIKAF